MSKTSFENTTLGNVSIYCGDALTVVRELPEKSISLILTDPPYHSTKKTNIAGDRDFKNDDEYLTWMGELFVEWKRVLKPNGSLYLFCASNMAAQLEVLLGANHFNVLSHIVWTKPNAPGYDGWKQKMKKSALRKWYPHSERILFAELQDSQKSSTFGNLLKTTRKKCGMSYQRLAGLIGAYGKVNRGGSVSNWENDRSIPNEEQYSKLRDVFLSTGKITHFPTYEEAIRTFKVTSKMEFTDVWSFPNVRPYKGKHPAEKPLQMLLQIIKASSNEGDIILDCFAGSGSTLLAANSCGRKSVGVVIVPELYEAVVSKMNVVHSQNINLLDTEDLKNVTKSELEDTLVEKEKET